MALVISNLKDENAGSQMKKTGTIAFDNSYAGNPGETLLAASLGLSRFSRIKLQSEQGFDFSVNYGTGSEPLSVTIGVFNSGSGAHTQTGTLGADVQPLIVEEVVGVAADFGSLANFPSYIVAVEATAGGSPGGKYAIQGAEVPAAGEVAIDYAAGSLTFAAADGITSARVTYFPVRAGTLFAATAFTEESVIAAAAGVNLASRAAMVQHIYDSTGGSRLSPVPPGEAPGVGEVALNINNAGATTITTNAGIDGNSLKVRNMAFSNLPSPDMFIDDTDITLVAEAYNFTENGHYPFLVVPAFGTNLVGEDGAAANKDTALAGPSATAAALLARWRPARNDLLTNEAVAMVTTAISWVILPHFIAPGSTATFTGGTITAGVAEEVSPAVDLSALTAVEFEAYGW